jgi:hypothetical protein
VGLVTHALKGLGKKRVLKCFYKSKFVYKRWRLPMHVDGFGKFIQIIFKNHEMVRSNRNA